MSERITPDDLTFVAETIDLRVDEDSPPIEDTRDAEIAALRAQLRQIVEAHDSGNVQMASPEIGGEEGNPPHPWHEEWLHGARALIAKADKATGDE